MFPSHFNTLAIYVWKLASDTAQWYNAIDWWQLLSVKGQHSNVYSISKWRHGPQTPFALLFIFTAFCQLTLQYCGALKAGSMKSCTFWLVALFIVHAPTIPLILLLHLSSYRASQTVERIRKYLCLMPIYWSNFTQYLVTVVVLWNKVTQFVVRTIIQLLGPKQHAF